MKPSAVLAIIMAACAFANASSVAAECQCAANGTRYDQGAVVCLDVPEGRYLAVCGKVLNNSSWKKLQNGCPLSLATSAIAGLTNTAGREAIPTGSSDHP